VKILHRHILISHLLNLGLTLAVFTAVLLLCNIFKDIMALLTNQGVSIFALGKFFLLLLPYILSFSMPMALMAATLLVMGRVSADNELNAARSCGISLFELVLPLCGVAAILSFACLYVNCTLAPQTKYLFNKAFIDLALQQPIALLEEGQDIKQFPDMVLYIRKRDISTGELEDVQIKMMSNNEMTQDIYARRGKITSDREKQTLRITLYDARIDQRNPQDPGNLEKRKWGVTVAEYPIELDATKLADPRRAVKEVHHHTTRELLQQAQDLKSLGIHPTPILVEVHKRFALSVACISFLLISIPLGIRAHRSEVSIGLLMSLALTVFYYFLIIFAETLKKNPSLYPEFVVWLPNLIFQGIGLWLLWRQHRV
jgi:lipopolysaccharide export system permease protein